MPSELTTSDGGPFSSNALKTIKIVSKVKKIDLIIYPSPTAHGGQEPFYKLTLSESLMSPIVSGTLIVKDVGNFVENLNLEGFETIEITFQKTTESAEIVWKGIITDVTLVSDDAVLVDRMNSLERYRFYNISFMNRDIFISNYKTPQSVPENALNITDFVGWISKG